MFQCIEAHAPEAAALRDIDRGYRRDRVASGGDRTPDSKALENQPCAVRERKRPVAPPDRACGASVQCDGVETVVRKCERQGRADGPGSDDDEIT